MVLASLRIYDEPAEVCGVTTSNSEKSVFLS